MEDLGIKKGFTKDKLDGTYKRPAEVDDDHYTQTNIEYYIVEEIKLWLDKYPDMFQKVGSLRDELLKEFKLDRTKLKKYPQIIKAMFKDMEVPEDLKIEE